MTSDEPHDVFISYAREDSAWVRRYLYEPLLQCRTAQARPPRIFFDVGEDGIRIGQNFMEAISGAIQKARKIVPVYSRIYFEKEMCLYELQLAHKRDVNGRQNILLPILNDPLAVSSVPFALSLINYWPVTDPDWFEKLCQSLELSVSDEDLSLTFLDQPGDVFANHTLPAVRVAVQSGGATIDYDEQITIRGEHGAVHGTTRATTTQGVATFIDLSIPDTHGGTRLIATSPTLGEVCSAPFAVVGRSHAEPVRPSPHAADPGRSLIPASGEVVFFAHGGAMAVIQPQRVLVYGVDGHATRSEPTPLYAPIRLMRRKDHQLVLADWQGNVYLLWDDGRSRVWRFGQSVNGLVVPADIDWCGERIYVSFWSGSIFQIDEDGNAELVLREDRGVQAAGVSGDRLLVCDFAGHLRVYRDGRLASTSAMELVVWLLKDTASGLMAVGDRKFYHLSSDGTRMCDFDLPLGRVAGVYEMSQLPIVIDTDGKGIRFDDNLVVSATFATQPGAYPVCADDAGTYCVFANLDRTHTLMLHNRIIFSHGEGSLSVSPDGRHFTIGDARAIRILTRSDFEAFLLENSGEFAAAPTTTADSV
jgi:hypothetical protein